MRLIKLLIVVLLLGLVVVFAIQNAALLELDFLVWKITARRAIVLFAVLAIGIFIGWAMRGGRRH